MLASLAVVLALIQTVASCPFAEKHGSLRAPNDEIHRRLATTGFLPNANLFPTCSLGTTQTSAAKIQSVYNEFKVEFNALIDRSHEFARSNIFGAALRLAFHDAGEVDLRSADSLGSDGCLSNSEANSGLIEPTTVLMTVFEPMWQRYCDRISRADFWVLLGKLAAEKADPTHTMKIPFQYGRKDNAHCDAGAGRLPEHQPGLPEFTRVFIEQMGLTMHDAVALLGAHTVGHVHPEFSGFGNADDAEWLKTRFADNAWDETPEHFDHQYYRSLLLETWQNDINKDRPTLNTWLISRNEDVNAFEPPEGPTNFVYNTLAAGSQAIEGAIGVGANKDAAQTALVNPGADEPTALDAAGGFERRLQSTAAVPGAKRNHLHINTIMLNADMAMLFPIHTDQNLSNGAFTGVDEEVCGAVLGPNGQVACSSSKYNVVSGAAPTYGQVKAYSENNGMFLKDFADAYVKMTTVGYAVNGATAAAPANKLGVLHSIDLGDYWAEPAHSTTSSSSVTTTHAAQPYMHSPYGKLDEICPQYDGATYYVDGWPGTPYKITPFQNAFANPVAAMPTHTECREDGHCIKSFEMDVKEVKARVWDRAIAACQQQPATTFMSYNGSLPGPTITMPVGHESLVRFNNKITVTEEFERKFKPCVDERTGRPFSVHFHGSASLAPFDGWADDETCFGETKDYVYPNNRPNTGWYHDHGVHITADNAYDGMAGFYIISSKVKYGGTGEPYNLEDMEEKLVVMGDKLLDDQCQLRMEPKTQHERSFYGDINTVNGIPFPVMTIEPKWIRFRLLSAAVSRPYYIRIKTEDGQEISGDKCFVIGSDGGYRHEPAAFPHEGLFMGIGERYEVVCDFSQYTGKSLIVWNDKDFSQMKDVPYYCYSHLVMKINVLSTLSTPNPAVFQPDALPADHIVPIKQVLSQEDYQKAMDMAENGKYHRRMDFGRRWGMWVINGETWTSFKIAADDIGQNTWEVWLLRTGGGWFHPIHLHLVDFYVLRRDGGSGVQPYEKMVAKDVVELGPSNNVYLLARFGAHRGDYMFHCHNLIHEDADMLRAFHMVSSHDGMNAKTAEKYVENPLNGIIYSNYKYADPMFGETAAKPTGTKPAISTQFVRDTLQLNLYRIFYPLPKDKEMYGNLKNPWESKWASMLPAAYGQCGGKGWTGPTTCSAGYECQVVSEWYSQCNPAAPREGEQAPWGQCGGQAWTGLTTCSGGYTCVADSQWYSQCKPSSTAPATTTKTPSAAPSTAPVVVTKAPSMAPTKTATPTTAPVAAQAGWGQCGGQGWAGPTTCVAGYTCEEQSKWYSQCKPVAAAANQQVAWGQCGGQGWTGLTQCVAGYTCVADSKWYSQCRPAARRLRGRM